MNTRYHVPSWVVYHGSKTLPLERGSKRPQAPEPLELTDNSYSRHRAAYQHCFHSSRWDLPGPPKATSGGPISLPRDEIQRRSRWNGRMRRRCKHTAGDEPKLARLRQRPSAQDLLKLSCPPNTEPRHHTYSRSFCSGCFDGWSSHRGLVLATAPLLFDLFNA